MPDNKSVLNADRVIYSWWPASVSTLVLMVAIGLMFYAMTVSITPCGGSVAHAQGQCEVGDEETFTGSTTFEGEINVGATPNAGTAGYLMESAGDNTPPEWVHFDAVGKPANESVTASTTLQVDDDFTFPAVANASYKLDFTILYTTPAAADLKFQILAPAGASVDGFADYDSGTGGAQDYFTEAAALVVADNTGTDQILRISAVVNIAGTAGDVNFFWAQNTSNASPATLYIGSSMEVRRVN